MASPVNSAHRFGAQVWLEPDDSAERVDHLFHMLAESGMGWARLFLMWPWIEPQPDEWDFSLFDAAFDAAARHGIRIKATLTANSGPWHIGTPSVLHSFTGVLDDEQVPAMERYVRQCVKRYKDHPAMGQWLLWNEPYGKATRTEKALRHWREWLKNRFQGELEPLNRRWRTGYAAFGEIPFPEEVAHPMHRGDNWNSYGPWLLDWKCRSERIVKELEWIQSLVRELDPGAETVINPNQVIANHAESGTDLQAMARLADVLGASFHPAWHFTFARRSEFPALIAAGVRLLQQEETRVEVTELQFGNTVNSSLRPSSVHPVELQQFLLAGLAAGAEQVIGWCLNVRSQDFEAGDWGLLDNMDQPSPRSRALQEISVKLASLEKEWGALQPATPEAHVLVDAHSQAVEWTEAKMGPPVPGRRDTDAAQGAGKIAALLQEAGFATALTAPSQLPDEIAPGTLILVSHLVAVEAALAEKLISLARAGACLIIDGTSARKDPDARLHRPWPVGFKEIGLRAADLESNPDGYSLIESGEPAGETILTRLVPTTTDENWKPWGALRFADDQSPVILGRSLDSGQILLFRGMLGPSLLYKETLAPSLRKWFSSLAAGLPPRPRPADPRAGTISVPCQLGEQDATLLLQSPFAPSPSAEITVHADTPSLSDVWTGQPSQPRKPGLFPIPLIGGIALLINPEPNSPTPHATRPAP